MGHLSLRAGWLASFVVLVSVLSTPATVRAQGTTALFYASQSGDYIGQGETRTYTDAEAKFTIGSTSNRVSVRIDPLAGSSFWWSLELSAPEGVSVGPGTYVAARRYPFTSPVSNGLSFSGSGRGCNTLTGRFVVLEAVYGSGGTVQRFAADFEQHCEDADAGLFGAIRYNSTIATLSPFGGSYPALQLELVTPEHGTISSTSGLSCGTDGSSCSATFGAVADVTLTATPDAGYLFAGWTDDCRGGTSATVRVNSVRQCGARFEPISTSDPRTLILFDSRAGDPAGGGKPQVYSSANSRITAQYSTFSGLTFRISSNDSTREATWTLVVAPPTGQALSEGTYEGALSSTGPRPALHVNYCSNGFGRFIVREIVLNGDTVTRAAVDIEEHCGNSDPGFFAAIRFNSTVTDVTPFGGGYPVYQLLIAPPQDGTISGGGILCGTGGSACELNLGAAATVNLVAAPAPGYVFAGWTGGACLGEATLAVRVNMKKICSAVFEPLAATIEPRSRVTLDFMPGAKGTGSPAVQEALSGLSAPFTANLGSSGRWLEFSVATLSTSGSSSSRRFAFSSALGLPLAPGTYMAVRYPFANAVAGMDVTSTCNELTGRFVILELVIGSNGSVQRAAIDFEQHCEDADVAVFGALRFNSTLSAVPFGGEYPRYSFRVAAPAHGTVTGSGLACGGAQAGCRIDRDAPGAVSVVATADPGYVFAGWTGACHGGESITFRLNTVRECGALFARSAAGVPRTLLRLTSQPGEPILAGRREVYSLFNSVWSASVTSTSLTFAVSGRSDTDEDRWTLMFRTAGSNLAVGTYTNASSSFSSTEPLLYVFGPSSCLVRDSTFTVRELLKDSQGVLLRAAVDFEQHCNTISSPALIGTIEYDVSAADVGRMSLDKTSLAFASTAMPDNTIGNTTSPQLVRLAQLPGPDISWTATTSASWLRVSPASGIGPATLTVSVEPGIAGIGTHTAAVTVVAGTETLPPVSVTWTLHPGTTSPPFGRFETPVSMIENLTGAVALTGWALDDVEVTDVQIWRLPHPADPAAAIFQGPGPPNGKIFVGHATLIDGARPDVEAAFDLPNRSRAGWGYMMLTRGLIWDGQGLFTVHAIATDREGHVREIGSTAFSVDNALATKPFGTIDTPGQGAVAAGLYPNTGWALPHAPGATIPAANVRVMIDGAFVPGVPSTAARSDITATFPTFDTSEAGRGLFIDTRGYADGMHTIAWIVTDSEGNSDGLGSRFFRIANGGASSLKAAERAASRAVAYVSLDGVDAAPAATSPVRMRRGFDPDAAFEWLTDASTAFAVDFEELDRLELRLEPSAGVAYTGYMRALGELRPLPAGAALDPSAAIFTWQPPAGFLGRYDFVFVARDAHGNTSRRDVRVTVRPRTQ